MKKYTKFMIGKALLILLHFIAFAFFVIAVSLLYTNDNFKKGIGWVNSEVYQDSLAFSKQLEQDIEDVFNYIRFRDVFELDGVMDIHSDMFNINIGPGDDRTYTMQDVMNIASQTGYYIDQDYMIKKSEKQDAGKAPDKMQEEEKAVPDASYLVNWKAYAPNEKLKEPGDRYMTLHKLVLESIERFNLYNKAYRRLYLTPSNIKFRVVYEDTVFTNAKELNEETVREYGKYLKLSSEIITAESNLKIVPPNLVYLASESEDYMNSDYTIYIAVDTAFPENDPYRFGNKNYLKQRDIYFYGMIIAASALLLMLVTLLLMLAVAGRQFRKSKEYKLLKIDRLSVESNIIICIFAIIVFLFITEKVGTKVLHIYLAEKDWNFGEAMMQYAAVYCCVLFTLLSIVRGAKAGVIWKNSLMRRALEETKLYAVKHSYSRVLTYSFGFYFLVNILIGFGISILFFKETMLVQRFITSALILVFLLFNILAFHMLYKKAAQNDKLDTAVRSISNGDIAYKLQLEDFTGRSAEVAQNINNISFGLENAISEQVKSERMKADLITNVSHDIKTPLTSIINYVDLIKRENSQNPKIREYIEILEKKSHHLKTLTEDLVEASKVSSGSVSVELRELDLIEMIQQTNGEFEEKYESKNLQIISDYPDQPALIEADGRHLWRVLENIYNNAYKYAIASSRVYVSVKIEGQEAVFTMKNVSERPLNVSPEELTERFVRGDVSRTTEGSGLGLSIAKSLTLLQGGKFEIGIDGDLFKVILTFSLAEEGNSVRISG